MGDAIRSHLSQIVMAVMLAMTGFLVSLALGLIQDKRGCLSRCLAKPTGLQGEQLLLHRRWSAEFSAVLLYRCTNWETHLSQNGYYFLQYSQLLKLASIANFTSCIFNCFCAYSRSCSPESLAALSCSSSVILEYFRSGRMLPLILHPCWVDIRDCKLEPQKLALHPCC